MAHPQKNVAERIEQLLARCEKLKRASAVRRVTFDDEANGKNVARAATTPDDDNAEKGLHKFS